MSGILSIEGFAQLQRLYAAQIIGGEGAGAIKLDLTDSLTFQ
jgi:hypothetical protein